MKRFTDTELWDKEWFFNLKPRLKCLVKYVRDKCDAAGVWQPNWTLAQTYIKDKVSEEELLKIDAGNQFKKMPNGLICCVGFINFQYGELKETCPPHRKILSLVKKYGIESDRVLLGYSNPTSRVQEKEQEEEPVEEKEKEKVRVAHLFSESEFFDKQKFIETVEANEKYLCFDMEYYYEKIVNWSAEGNKKKDWIATSRNFMLGDLQKGTAKIKTEFQGKIKSINHGKQTGGFSNEELIAAAKRAAAGVH